ncbi:MAG: hydroxymethylbilane synthase [Limisphaerales bacterium]|jgi:hydroxymethylbilane synthase
MRKPVIVGSRASKLARWQADYTIAKLKEAGFETELKLINTSGDKDRISRFSEMQGFGFFTGELEQALLSGEVDLAVHSFKDLPTTQAEGLVIAGCSYRADPADVLLVKPGSRDATKLLDLKAGAVVGTSSVRRKNQILALRPDLKVTDLRGNVPTRIQKLHDGQYDAIMLAAAGIERLKPDLGELELVRLNPKTFVPAPAQGVLAYETRRGDQNALDAVAAIHDERAAMVVRAERKLLSNLNGGCHLPFGAYCEEIEGVCHFWISKATKQDEFPLRLWIENPDPDVLVVEAWQQLHKEKPSSVFISRVLDDDSIFLRAMHKHNIKIHAESLIDFTARTFKLNKADWLFFSSKTAVKMFVDFHPELSATLNNKTETSKIKLAAIGNGTAKELLKAGFKADFIADPLDMNNSILNFASLAQGTHVVFPGAENGLRTAQKIIEQSDKSITVEDIIAYSNTSKKGIDIPQTDIVVLTSPLNVDTYFDAYPERMKSRFVAIGESTAKALQNRGAYKIFISRRPSELALIECVFSS